MLTHSNMVSALFSLVGLAERTVNSIKDDDKYIGYLPLAHVLELLAEHTMYILGVGIGYSSPNTLIDTSTTVMAAVPVILDRIYKGINAKVAASGPFKAALVDFCVRYRDHWVRNGYDTPIMNKLIFGNFKQLLGGQVKVMLSGGAPLAEEAHSFIRTALCLKLHHGYGLTETASTAIITDPDDISVGRVGSPLQGVDIKVVAWG